MDLVKQDTADVLVFFLKDAKRSAVILLDEKNKKNNCYKDYNLATVKSEYEH
jgi:hypothetical protein